VGTDEQVKNDRTREDHRRMEVNPMQDKINRFVVMKQHGGQYHGSGAQAQIQQKYHPAVVVCRFQLKHTHAKAKIQ